MRYYIIGLMILIVVAIVLYFVLTRLYDVVSQKEQVSSVRRGTKRKQLELELERERLVEKRKQLENAIEIRSNHFQSLMEIKELEKELAEVNDVIDNINKETIK